MADKKLSMQVFFKIRDNGYRDIVASCADNADCPVCELLDACKAHYATYRYIHNELRAICVSALKDKNATNDMINLSEYLCKNCKNRVR